MFPHTKTGVFNKRKTSGIWSDDEVTQDFQGISGDSGSASRYFYTAKASKSERNKGLEGFELRPGGSNAKGLDRNRPVANHHPTVKPVKLMQYLVKLVTPKGGTVLDPFTGSGTTGIACKLEGMEFVGIEREQEYVDIANARIEAWEPDKQETLL